MKVKLLLSMLAILAMLFSFGCSNQNYKSISKQILTDKDWDINAIIEWNNEIVVGRVEARYKGNLPLEYVTIEPDFRSGDWPSHYKPPVRGKYTWNAEKPGGAIPDVKETSTMSTSVLSKKPSKLMKESEAVRILEDVKINIQWKVASETEPRTFSNYK
ncbi:hypothetical protein P378_04290 [Desulforamulus profundi]|uniref:Lipoprotein n=1 Tax=Desulforamulus profundi TaxID=1383067 RepID=A0A2C6MA93_9FIRM|nr:hypothetical protein [Desulforamulus profundi]PHJ39277.1 hypothetical protein P378_04290 [Desulforamulus profundi]